MRGEKSPCPMSQICCQQSPAEQPEYENQNLNIEAIKIHLWITRFLQQSTLPSSYHWKYIGTIYIIINVILIKKIRNSNPAWVSHELTQKKYCHQPTSHWISGGLLPAPGEPSPTLPTDPKYEISGTRMKYHGHIAHLFKLHCRTNLKGWLRPHRIIFY